jgi:UDP-N-acetylglucosamine transferase subunit ALG13
MHLYAQYPSWAGGRWKYRGSVFDDYGPAPQEPAPSKRARTVVVTFGTMRTYGFRRAVDAVLRTLPDIAAPDAQVLWQVGVTDVSDLRIEAVNAVPAASLKTAIASADLVIAHAGVGSALTVLDQGRAPVLLTRRKIYNEMVDDHQLMIAAELDRRGLAVSRDPDELTSDDLFHAMRMGVEKVHSPTAFSLD